MSNCARSLSEPEVSVVRLLKYLCLYRLVIAGKVSAMHAYGCMPVACQRALVNWLPVRTRKPCVCSTRTCTSCDICTVQCSTAGRSMRIAGYFRGWKSISAKTFIYGVHFGRISCDFRLDIMNTGSIHWIQGPYSLVRDHSPTNWD